MPGRVSRRSRAQHGRLTVALVGADGAGKSTISGLLGQAALPLPVKTIYMGVNLEASSLMLPTTRILLAAKRRRGGNPDLIPTSLQPASLTPSSGRSFRRTVRASARLTVWMFEEWLRQVVATVYGLRGFIVVFDRHFFADYYYSDIAVSSNGRPLFGRIHGWILDNVYPKPALLICLDAPSDVLFARKPDSSVEWLEQRRQQYLSLADVVPTFVLVDANRPLDAVLADVTNCIDAHWKVVTA